MRLDDAAVKLRDLIGPVLGVSRETIRRYEIGAVPEDEWDPIVIAGLADLYGVTIARLSPNVPERLDHLSTLVQALRMRGFATPESWVQESLPLGCEPEGDREHPARPRSTRPARQAA